MGVISRFAKSRRIKFKKTDGGFALGESTFIYMHSVYRRELTIEIDDLTSVLVRLSTPWTSVQLDSVGRIATIRLRTVEAVAPARAEILEAAADVVVSGYRWLEAGVMAVFSKLADELAADLYAEIRKRLPVQVEDLVRLAVISEQRIHYLLDSHGRDVVLKRARRPLLYLRVQPLVWEGRDLLTGSYPPALKDDVEPVLKSLRSRFKEIIERRGSMVKRLGDALRKQRALSSAAGTVAYTSGRLLGGLFNLPDVGGS